MSSDQSREEHMKHADGEMDGAKMAAFDDNDFSGGCIFNMSRMVAHKSTLAVICHVNFHLIHNINSYEIIVDGDYVRLLLAIVREHIFKTQLCIIKDIDLLYWRVKCWSLLSVCNSMEMESEVASCPSRNPALIDCGIYLWHLLSYLVSQSYCSLNASCAQGYCSKSKNVLDKHRACENLSNTSFAENLI